jgi:sugar phosphate isomerase/epimerase
MRLKERHLTYCTNVHAGETWPEVRDQVLPTVLEVKARAMTATGQPFGVGLRLSAAAAAALCEPEARQSLIALLAQHGLYVFTLNAFPYGEFHAAPVKEAVYEPDWRSPERLTYTNGMAELLAALLPDDVDYGSISSVPFGFRPHFTDAEAWRAAVENLLAHVAFLHALKLRTGRRIVLALEPEPCCALETIDDCIQVFARELHGARACAQLAALTGYSEPQARDMLHDHLGLCLDACHAAVEFEEAPDVLARLRAARIPIFKIQLSAGLRVPALSIERRAALAAFAEDVYLHQVVERRGGVLTRYLDLPQALSERQADPACEWRVHFHVPIFHRELGSFESTQQFLVELLESLEPADCAHLEVETYTWSVLPPALRGPDMSQDIANELAWARAQLEQPRRAPA